MNPIVPIAEAIKRQAARKPRLPEPMSQFRIFIGGHGGETQGETPAPAAAEPVMQKVAAPAETVAPTAEQSPETPSAKKRGRKGKEA